MPKPVLRFVQSWTVVDKDEAQRFGLPTQPLRSPEHAVEVLDNSVWVEAQLGEWITAYRLVNQRGQPVCAELRIFPASPATARPAGVWRGVYGGTDGVPSGGLSARLLRQVNAEGFRPKLKELLTRWAAELEAIHSQGPPLPIPLVPPRPTRGRKGRSDAELARIANAYESAYITGKPAVPAVAARFGISQSQARDAVSRARQRGLLSPASKLGKGGGTLTSLGQTVLQQTKKGG